MKNTFLYSSVLLALASCTTEVQQKPNIVFILADDMGYGDVSCLGAKTKLQTENIDRMAQEGVLFTDAHSSSSVSTPTRYGVLTGRYNWRSRLKSDVLFGYDKPIIKEDRETMASMLRRQGYTTAGIGKWHLGWEWNNVDAGHDSVDFSKPITNGPTTRGFDYFYGISGSLDMSPYVYVENDKVTALPNRKTVNKGQYTWWREGPTGADFEHEQVLPNFTNRACNYIKEKAKSDQPYFLYLAMPAPHTPILPTEEFRGKSGIGEYGDFVLMVDAMVGKVLQAVKESGEDENTIVVFTTDNGCSPSAGFEKMKELGHYANSIYRGYKSDLFDGGHRIPCVLRWPAKVKPHKVNQTICLTDFYATFAAAADHKLVDSEGEDSYNLMPALRADKEIEPIREATIHHSIDGMFTIRQGEWKLLLSAGSGGWSQPRGKKALEGLPLVQLYNMNDDPSETKNLQAEHPEKVRELRDLLLKYIRDGRSTPGAPQPNENGNEWRQVKEVMNLPL